MCPGVEPGESGSQVMFISCGPGDEAIGVELWSCCISARLADVYFVRSRLSAQSQRSSLAVSGSRRVRAGRGSPRALEIDSIAKLILVCSDLLLVNLDDYHIPMVGQPNRNHRRSSSHVKLRGYLSAGALAAVSTAMISSGVDALPPPSSCVSGTDFTMTSSGGLDTVVFTNTTMSCMFTIPAGVTSIEYLLVGGGGGGGGGGVYFSLCGESSGTEKPGGGGAGGGGGVVITGSTGVTPGASIEVLVGSGSSGGDAGGCGNGSQPTYTSDGAGADGASGGSSSLGATIAAGGLGGSGGTANGAGGSTGGSSGVLSGGTNPNTGDCSASAVTICFASPGGAGSSATGSNPTSVDCFSASGGAGGAGTYVSMTGSTYGGGGGGSTRHPFTPPCLYGSRDGGAGGAGGGGAGALGSGANGTDGLGGGGGGGRGNGSSASGNSNAGFGGSGGTGTVVIRYTTPGSVDPLDPGSGSSDGFALTWYQRGQLPNTR